MTGLSDEYVRVTATLRAITPDAVLLECGDAEAWIPRSCIHASDDIVLHETPKGAERSFQIREWIATKKGFI